MEVGIAVSIIVAVTVVVGIAVRMYVTKGNKGGARKPTRSEHDLPK